MFLFTINIIELFFGELDKFYPTFQVIFDSHCKINGYPPHISYLPFPCIHNKEDKELKKNNKYLRKRASRNIRNMEFTNRQNFK